MKRKILALLGVVVLLSSVLMALPAAASEPGPPPGLIAVDVDPYYKGLVGDEAHAIVHADTVAAAAELEKAVSADSRTNQRGGRKKTSSEATGGSAAGVGDVEFLYADGWREFTLRAIGGNAEVWVANDLSYCPGDPRPPDVVTQEQIDYLFNEFNNTIYPSNTTYFGFTNDRYGTDGLFASWGYDWYLTDTPQRVMILVYNVIDDSWCDPDYPFFVAGYFWPTMTEVYADRNIIHIDSNDWENRVGPNVPKPFDYEGTIAHEYEHAIHYDHDPDEASWVDEGMADLSGFLAGYGHSQSHLAYYLVYHRTPLTLWRGGLEDYGESYLFQLYLMENFGGPDFITALVDEPQDGIAGIESQLAAFGYSAPFNDIYRDWTLANYLDDPSLIGGSGAQLGYDTLDIPSADTWGYSIQWSVEHVYGSHLDTSSLPRQRNKPPTPMPDEAVEPYGPSYFVYPAGHPELLASFDGDDEAGVAPTSEPFMAFGGHGIYAEVDYNTLTLATPIALGSGAALSFNTWYEIEEEWDFGLVQLSTDGGATWTSLSNPHTTYECDPSCAFWAELPGFSGSSGGWQTETFDLSAYAGESVLVRFNYATDWYTEWQGWYVDDVVITDDTGTLLSDPLDDLGNWAAVDWELVGADLWGNDFSLVFLSPDQRSPVGLDIIEVSVNGVHQNASAGINTLFDGDALVTAVISNRLPESVEYMTRFWLDVIDVGATGE